MSGVKKIYLIRHGETDFNKEGKVQGCGIDASLNATGREQGRAFFEAYRQLPFDKIYTSQLKRTVQTVESFLRLDIPVEQHGGLNEINWGNYEGRKVSHEERTYYKSLLQRWRDGQTSEAIHGGESPEDVAGRQREFLDLILSRDHEDQILICMHGRAMRIFLSQLLNTPLQEMDTYSHCNVGLYIVHHRVSGGELIKENCRLHLDNLGSPKLKQA